MFSFERRENVLFRCSSAGKPSFSILWVSKTSSKATVGKKVLHMSAPGNSHYVNRGSDQEANFPKFALFYWLPAERTPLVTFSKEENGHDLCLHSVTFFHRLSMSTNLHLWKFMEYSSNLKVVLSSSSKW